MKSIVLIFSLVFASAVHAQSVTVTSGEHDGFPAYELYAGQTLIYSRMPVGDITNLFPPMDVTVFASDTAVRDTMPECCCCVSAGCKQSGTRPC